MSRGVQVETLSQHWRKARKVNYTTNGYPTFASSLTVPAADAGTATGQSAFPVGAGGDFTPTYAKVIPYAIGNDDVTFSVRVVGWTQAILDSIGVVLWVPLNLGIFACTAGATVGIAGATVLDTERFADTITGTKVSTLSGELALEAIFSPADDSTAHFLVHLRGSKFLQFDFTTGGSATSCNALWALL